MQKSFSIVCIEYCYSLVAYPSGWPDTAFPNKLVCRHRMILVFLKKHA